MNWAESSTKNCSHSHFYTSLQSTEPLHCNIGLGNAQLCIYYEISSKNWCLLHCCFTKAHFASDNISRGRYASSRCSRVFYIFHRMVEPYPTLQWVMLDVTEHFWPKIWSHFRPYCLSLHSLTVSFSSEPQLIFSHFFRNFVGLLQDYFLSISVLMLIPIISYIAQGQCFNFLLLN